MKKTLLLLLLTGLVAGCEKRNDTRIEELQNKITTLNSIVADLRNQELLTVTNVSNLNMAFYQSRYAFSTAPVTPQDKGYAFLSTSFGNLLVGTENVEPYLDGYKIHLKIGNPTSVRFNGFSLICSTFQSTNVFATLHSFTNNITDDLIPGYWTPIEVVLAPATMDEVRNASVSIELNQIQLSERPSPPR